MIKHNACPICLGDVIGRVDKKWCSEACRSKSRDKRPYNVRYYAENKEALSARNKQWREENREHVVLKRREWVAKNIDTVRAYQLEYQRKWFPANRDRQSEYQSRRRAARANSGSFVVTPRDYKRMTALFRGQCAYCPEPATEWDHVMPISRGGRHSIGNLLPACARCNRSKSYRTVMEWRMGIAKRKPAEAW